MPVHDLNEIIEKLARRIERLEKIAATHETTDIPIMCEDDEFWIFEDGTLMCFG